MDDYKSEQKIREKRLAANMAHVLNELAEAKSCQYFIYQTLQNEFAATSPIVHMIGNFTLYVNNAVKYFDNSSFQHYSFADLGSSSLQGARLFPTPELSVPIPQAPPTMFVPQRVSPADFIGKGPSIPLQRDGIGDFEVDFDFLNNNETRNGGQ